MRHPPLINCRITDSKYSRDYANSDTVASGQVISQTPDAGAKAKKGDSISIVVSQGKALVVVPNVVGKSETDARNELSGAGLTVTVLPKRTVIPLRQEMSSVRVSQMENMSMREAISVWSSVTDQRLLIISSVPRLRHRQIMTVW